MTLTERDYGRLARVAKARRMELGFSLDALAEQAGTSRDTYRRIEAGRAVRDLTYAQVESALAWSPGSCASVLGGGEPTLASDATGPTPGAGGAITEEDISGSILIATAKSAELSADQIRSIRDRVIEDLKQRGLL
ncbi:helix-turn-helix domain-containing protein [Streptomyces xanthophaeus]